MKTKNKLQRAVRVRRKLQAVGSKPRLNVFRSNAHIWAQVIDDSKGKTIAAANDLKLKGTKIERATLVGQTIADLALKSGVKQVIFDRGPYRFHGRVKAVAEGARQKGLTI